MGKLASFRDLDAWRVAIDLTVDVYRISDGFPETEIYGITSQLRRAVVSVASNIAEGKGRGSDNEFRRYLKIARGSLYEVETQLVIAQKLGFLDELGLESVTARVHDIGRLINGLLRYLETHKSAQAKA